MESAHPNAAAAAAAANIVSRRPPRRPRLAAALGGGALAVLLAGLQPALAQSAPAADGWKVSGSMRVRYEAVANQVRPGFNDDDALVNLRTTLFAEHRSGPLRIGGEIYDSRVWGGDRRTPMSTSEVNTFELVQAYAAVDLTSDALGPVSVQAGRFLLNLGSRRVIAADDYRNTTNSYAGVRADLAPMGLHATLFYVQPVVRLPDRIDALLDNRQHPDSESRAMELWGAVAAKPKAVADATLEATYVHFEERDRPGRPTLDRSLDTYGARIIRDPKAGRADYEVEVLRQTGEVSASTAASAARQTVAAGFLHADAGYSFEHRLRPRLSAEFDWVSGDRPGGKYGRFDTLFGMRRGDFAASGIFAAIGRANMVTPGVRLELSPSGPWDGFVSLRGLWLEARQDAFSTTGVRDRTGASGRYAGAMAEGRWRYWLVKDRLRAEVDGAWLAKGHFLDTAPNATGTGAERYVSLNLTAQF